MRARRWCGAWQCCCPISRPRTSPSRCPREPETQFGLSDGRRTTFADLRLGRHLIEFDGRVKYQRTASGGLARSDVEQVVWEEKRRQDWLCGFKLGMSRLTWSDVLGPGRAGALARLQREIADTDARFGTSIADLAPYVVRRGSGG